MGKQPVVGTKDRDTNQMRGRVVEGTDARTLLEFEHGTTERESSAYNDGDPAYIRLASSPFPKVGPTSSTLSVATGFRTISPLPTAVKCARSGRRDAAAPTLDRAQPRPPSRPPSQLCSVTTPALPHPSPCPSGPTEALPILVLLHAPLAR